LNSLLSILVICLPYYERKSREHNIILNEFIDEDKETYYKEKLLELTNRGSQFRLDKCM